MAFMNIKCPNCGRMIKKHILKITQGRCNNCHYLLANSLTMFTTARARIQTRYATKV